MTLDSPDPQLVLKITPPRIAKTVLDRSRLSSLRPEFADKAVIAVQTSAGSGKTSLLAQWRKEGLQKGAMVAWLSLDRFDNGGRFVRGLTLSMRSASGRQGFGSVALRVADSDPDSLEGLTAWLAEIAGLSTETLLILDDVHSLPESTRTTFLIYLLLNAPANLKIVLASRRPISLPTSELPARGSFVALNATDLNFHQDETVALLKARFGQRIDTDSCARLHQLTEGWPLGVQLAVSTIERSKDLREAITGFAVQSSDIQRYFVECLVDRLPPTLAQQLVALSFVDALSAGLCEAILELDDATAILTQVGELTPIFTEGAQGEWIRMHPLAREFLQERFERLPEASRRDYRTRAGHWLAENKQYEQAARQLLNAGLEDIAYDLIGRSLHDLVIQGQVARVTEWIERLPRSEIECRPSLRITLGWLLAQSERHAEAMALLSPLADDENVAVGDRCESAEVCATAALFADDIDLMGRIISGWQQALPGQSALLKLVGVNQMALLALYQGSPEQARYAYTQIDCNESVAGRYALGWRDWVVGYSYLWEGHVALAVQKLVAPLARAESESGRRSPITIMLASALATAQLECDQVDEAASLLADRLDILERRTPPDAIAMGFITAVRIAVIQGEDQRAFDLLDYLLALGSARNLPRLCIVSLGERIRLHSFRGRGDICAVPERKLDAMVAELGEHSWGLLTPVIKLQVGLAHVYSAVARQDWKRALEVLEPLVSVVARSRRGREVVQVFLLKALAKKRCGEDGTQILHEALGMAKLWGFARIVADTHPDLPDWVKQQQATSEAAFGLHERFAATEQAVPLFTKVPGTARFKVASSSLLSPKEREVLQLLAGNMSNKQIALAMGVSDETIKWHLKNLFGKLNAGTRKHLLDRARMLGILDSVA